MCCGSSFFRKSLFMIASLMSFLVLGWKYGGETNSASQFYLYSPISHITNLSQGALESDGIQHPLSLDPKGNFVILKVKDLSDQEINISPECRVKVSVGKRAINSFMSDGEFVQSLSGEKWMNYSQNSPNREAVCSPAPDSSNSFWYLEES